MGVEQSANSLKKVGSVGCVPPLVPPSVPITPELSELIGLWARLDKSARADLLRVARGLAGCEVSQ